MRSQDMIKLKVCGMRDPENIREVAALNTDYMGFIFFEGSKRFVGHDFVIPDDISDSIKKVGVFVNQPIYEIVRLANRHRLDFIQLHGNETTGDCREIHAKGFGVIKAFRVDKDFDFEGVKAYRDYTDYFLFDAKGVNYGGNGVPFDWTYLHKYDQEVPFFLSGGISADNVAGIKALKTMNLHALDLNSKVENDSGLKDIELIRQLKINMSSNN